MQAFAKISLANHLIGASAFKIRNVMSLTTKHSIRLASLPLLLSNMFIAIIEIM